MSVSLALASRTIPRSNVTTAVGFLVIATVDANIASLTPGGRPRVADEPVFLSVFFAVTNQDDSVINVGVNLVAAVEDAAVISVPVVGINRDGNRSKGGNSIQQFEVVVFGKLYES